MDFKNFTQKSIQALNDANEICKENQNQQISTLHLFLALVKDDGGLTSKILQKLNVSDEEIKNIILENYMTELKENFAPKVISSGSGERVPLQKNNETPSSLKEVPLSPRGDDPVQSKHLPGPDRWHERLSRRTKP